MYEIAMLRAHPFHISNLLTNFMKLGNTLYHWMLPQGHVITFRFPTISYNNIADIQACVVGAALAPLNLVVWKDYFSWCAMWCQENQTSTKV